MLDAAQDEADLDVLLRDWSLTKGDLREIHRARSQGRLWTALHLCSLRRTGRFVDDPKRVPHEALVHLAGQIGIHPPATPIREGESGKRAVRATASLAPE